MPGKKFIHKLPQYIKTSKKSGDFFHNSTKKQISDYSKFSYFKLTSDERERSFTEMLHALPQGPDVVYRGTVGNKEIIHAKKSGFLGISPKESKKLASLDIVSYVESNNSSFFYSTTPCQYTVMMYTEGLSLIPTVGNIMVMNLPKVFVKPQTILALNPGAFTEYDEKQLAQRPQDEVHRFIPIADRTSQNNEVTAVLGKAMLDDWRLSATKDLSKVIQVCGPGHLLKSFISTKKPIHIQEWDNAAFRKRAWSIEIVMSEDNQEDLFLMNQRAMDMGLIKKGMRLITLEDAAELVRSKEMQQLENEFTVENTEIFASLPVEIQIGNKKELIEYAKSILDNKPREKY